MPVILLERLPLPSLKTYTCISVTLLACAIYFAQQTVHEAVSGAQNVTQVNVSDTSNETLPSAVSVTNGTSENISDVSITLNQTEPIPEDDDPIPGSVFEVMLHETWCVCTLINSAYCCLILWGKMIQKLVFGDLRVSEQQHIKDKFWNFVFYKFIFIFGVMNVQLMDEVVYWCAWFSILGFLHLLAQLCKDRFEYLSFSPTTPAWTHAKVLLLLVGIQAACFFLLSICSWIGYMYAGWNTFAFMAAECVLLIIRTLYVLMRYAIHLYDLNHDGVWENRAIYVYYSELIFELAGLSVDFAHHLHMLVWGNIFLSMASLVICMQLRYLFHEVQRRVKRHKNYLRVVNSMEAKFPMATLEDLDTNSDDCAICWERMESARKLPCGHLFHDACLRSWLEQDTSCPTCRGSLSDLQAPVNELADLADRQRIDAAGDAPAPAANIALAPPGNHFTNHFFHFDGSRYVSWLPSFSVEVTHTQILGNGVQQRPMQSSQLDNMARQVQEVFPSMPVEIVIDDLRITRSVEVTIENIIEGRVTVPVNYRSNARDSENNNGEANSQASSSASAASDSSEEESEEPEYSDNLYHEAAPVVLEPAPHELNLISDRGPSESAPVEENKMSDFEPFAVAGSRFSKSPMERETMLSSRKESLLEQARKRFLMKQSPTEDNSGDSHESQPGTSSESSSAQLFATPSDATQTSGDNLRRRRELAFRAALNRMHQQD